MKIVVTIVLLFAGFVLMSNGQRSTKPIQTTTRYVSSTSRPVWSQSTTKYPSMSSSTMRPIGSQSTTRYPYLSSSTMGPIGSQSTTRYPSMSSSTMRPIGSQSTTRYPYLSSSTMRRIGSQSTTRYPSMSSSTMRPIGSQSTTRYPFLSSSTMRPIGSQPTTRYPFMYSSTTRYPYVPTTTRPVSGPSSSVRPQTSTLINLPTIFPTGVPKTTPNNLPPPINDNPALPCGYSNYTEKNGASSVLSGQGIVGGVDARVNEFPYQARITFNGGFICGGSIISNRHILTAAHCIIGTSPSSFAVVLGDHNRNTPDAGEQTYKIAKVIVHPKNSKMTNQFDFAMLVTADNIALDRKLIRPVCLPDSSQATDALVGQTGIITGWGKTLEGGALSTVLQKGSVPVLSQDECTKSYGSMSITSDMMCAGYKAGGIDSCQGDSGGPLMTISSNGRFYLQGVTSWGAGCARQNYPGVYARVASVIDWIKSTMASR